ncbi:MAG: TRAP transporter small permease [Pseudomonadota bacterium]
MLAKLDRIGRFVENLLLVGLLAGMMLISVAQIVAREVFETGFFWSGELVRLMVLWLAMVGAVAACREDRHIRIDAVAHLLSAKTNAAFRMVVDLFAAAVCGLLAWHAYRWVREEYGFQDTVVLDIPSWVAHAPVPIALALMCYRFLLGVLKTAMRLWRGEVGEAT